MNFYWDFENKSFSAGKWRQDLFCWRDPGRLSNPSDVFYVIPAQKSAKPSFLYPNLGLRVIRQTSRSQDKKVQVIGLFKENILKMAENNDVWKKRWTLCATCHFVVFTFSSQRWGHRAGGPTPPVVIQPIRVLWWRHIQVMGPYEWLVREAPRGIALLVLKASPPKAALGSSSSRLSPWERPTAKQEDPELRGFFIRELEQRGNGDSGWGDSFFAVWSNPMPVPLPTSWTGVPHLSQGCRCSGMEQLPQDRAYLGVRQKQCFHQRRK